MKKTESNNKGTNVGKRRLTSRLISRTKKKEEEKLTKRFYKDRIGYANCVC